jgi:hypothetical protein
MRHIEVVAGAFAIMEDKEVIGIVTKVNDTQWGFFQFVEGTVSEVSSYIPLQNALDEGIKFKRKGS